MFLHVRRPAGNRFRPAGRPDAGGATTKKADLKVGLYVREKMQREKMQ
jgi:hypothetical protein